MPLFETIEDALTYVRYEISKQKGAAGVSQGGGPTET